MVIYTYIVKKGQSQVSVRLDNGQTMFVYNGGKANRITVGDRSFMGIDGNAAQTTVLNGGTLSVFRGIANVLTVSEGGQVNISSGGSTSGTTVHNGGEMYIINGKSLNTKLNGGTMNVGYSNGHRNANNASAENTTVNSGGRMIVSSGGRAVDNKINNAGEMIISSAGSASETTVSSGGTMTIAYGGTHYNKLHITDGGRVIAEEYSNICFSLSGKKPSEEYYINDVSRIEGSPDYSISIKANQTSGIYNLAGNAVNIANVNISIDGRQHYAEINGDGFFYKKNYYMLKRTEEDVLQFIIAAPPSVPKVTVSSKKLTNQDVILTAAVKDGSTVQYSLDGENWLAYEDSVIAEQNGAYYFRAVNSADMYSKIYSYNVKNIDKDAPEQTITITQHPKNINQTLKVSASDISKIASIMYSFDQENWSKYNTKKGIKVTENSTVYIKSTDKAGNSITESRTIELDTLPANNWTDLKTAGASSENLGHADIKNITGWVGIDDDIDYFEVNLTVAGKYSFDLNAADKTKFTIYQLNSKTNSKGVTTYSLKSLQSTTLKYDKTSKDYSAETKGLLLEEGTYYVAMRSTNAKSGGNADYSVKVNEQTIYYTASKDGKSDDWQDMKTAGASSEYLAQADIENIEGWVGFGDNIDYYEFTLDGAATLNFALSADDKTKFTIYKLNSKTNKKGVTTYSLKSLQSTTLKYDKTDETYSAVSKDLLLAKGSYYIAVQSTNAKSGGSSNYCASAVKYDVHLESEKSYMADNSDDTWKLAAAKDTVSAVNDWVGYGDAADYFKFEIAENGRIMFDCSDADTAQAISAKELKISCLNSKGKSVSMQLQNGSYISKKEMAAGEYYIGIKSSNAKKYHIEYNIAIETLT